MNPPMQDERPLVTVCVVTRNQARYIEQCLRSVLDQEPDVGLEILVGDDASEDATPSLLAELAAQSGGQLRAHRHDARLGAVGNIKFLLRRARGEFIAHLDGDDYWLPCKLHEQVQALRAAPEAVAVYCNALVVDESDRPYGLFNNPLQSRFDLEEMLARGNFLNNSSMMFRRSALDALLRLPDDYLDYRTHLCLAAIGPLLYLNRPMTAYRRSSATSLVNNANERVRELYWQALEAGLAEVASPDVRREAMADFLRRVAFRALRTRDAGLMAQWWDRARRTGAAGGAMLAMAVIRNATREAMRQLRQAALVPVLGPKGRILYYR